MSKENTEKTEEGSAASDPSIVSKITTATIGCNPGQAKADEKEVLIANISGKASGVKHAIGKDGDPVMGVTGKFFGYNVQKDKLYKSGVLYLPGGIIELLIDAVVGEGELDSNDLPIYNTVEFAFAIYAVPAKNPIGYSFRAETLMKAKISDEDQRLMGFLTGGSSEQKALPKIRKSSAQDRP